MKRLKLFIACGMLAATTAVLSACDLPGIPGRGGTFSTIGPSPTPVIPTAVPTVEAKEPAEVPPPAVTEAPTVAATEGSSGGVTTDDLVAAFKVAGLEAENAREMSAKDYGAAPMVASQAMIFGIPSVCSDCNGRVFTFEREADRNTLKAYYETLGKSSALLFSWVFVEGNSLVQLNGDMEEATARKYEAVLKNSLK